MFQIGMELKRVSGNEYGRTGRQHLKAEASSQEMEFASQACGHAQVL